MLRASGGAARHEEQVERPSMSATRSGWQRGRCHEGGVWISDRGAARQVIGGGRRRPACDRRSRSPSTATPPRQCRAPRTIERTHYRRHSDASQIFHGLRCRPTPSASILGHPREPFSANRVQNRAQTRFWHFADANNSPRIASVNHRPADRPFRSPRPTFSMPTTRPSRVTPMSRKSRDRRCRNSRSVPRFSKRGSRKQDTPPHGASKSARRGLCVKARGRTKRKHSPRPPPRRLVFSLCCRPATACWSAARAVSASFCRLAISASSATASVVSFARWVDHAAEFVTVRPPSSRTTKTLVRCCLGGRWCPPCSTRTGSVRRRPSRARAARAAADDGPRPAGHSSPR